MDTLGLYSGIYYSTGWDIVKQTDITQAEKMFSRDIRKFIEPLLDYLIRKESKDFDTYLKLNELLKSDMGGNLEAMIKEKLSNPLNKGERFLKHVFDNSPNALTHFKKWLLGSLKYSYPGGTSSESSKTI